MIKDKGRMKWTAMITRQLPEKEDTENSAETDGGFPADIDMLIHEAMEYNWTLEYKLTFADSIHSLYGTTVFIDYLKKSCGLRIKSIIFILCHLLVSSQARERNRRLGT